MRTLVLLMFTLAALSGCTDDAPDDGHSDGCDHLTGDAHDQCHEEQDGANDNPDDGTGIDESMTHNVSIRFTGNYPVTVTYDQDSLTVPANTTIMLEFCNDDSPASPTSQHDFVVENIEGASTEIISGGTCATIEFFSGPPQETKFYCSVGQHRGGGMEGDFIVA